MLLPDHPRSVLSPPARALAATAIELSRRLAWRTLHPADREHFVEAPRPCALRRVTYEAGDGSRAALHLVEASAKGSKEPVIVAHALGLSPDAYRYGAHTLVDALTQAGFRVYLLTHRGDRDTHTSPEAKLDFDAIVEGDVPASLQAVREHSGFERVHWVGHGLGGQLGLVAGARNEALATVVALAAPVLFQRPRTEMRALSLVTRLLPEHLAVPAHWVARAALPTVGHPDWMGDASGERVRGVVEYGTSALGGGLVDQVSTWVREGTLTSRAGLVDYVSTFSEATMPLLVAYGKASTLANEASVCAALHSWGHQDSLALSVEGRTADLLFGATSSERVVGPLVRWLDERRRLAWGANYTITVSA